MYTFTIKTKIIIIIILIIIFGLAIGLSIYFLLESDPNAKFIKPPIPGLT